MSVNFRPGCLSRLASYVSSWIPESFTKSASSAPVAQLSDSEIRIQQLAKRVQELEAQLRLSIEETNAAKAKAAEAMQTANQAEETMKRAIKAAEEAVVQRAPASIIVYREKSGLREGSAEQIKKATAVADAKATAEAYAAQQARQDAEQARRDADQARQFAQSAQSQLNATQRAREAELQALRINPFGIYLPSSFR